MKTAEVAERLDISISSVRRLAQDGFIPCRIIPGRKNMYLFDRRSIENFITGYEEADRYEINLPS